MKKCDKKDANERMNSHFQACSYQRKKLSINRVNLRHNPFYEWVGHFLRNKSCHESKMDRIFSHLIHIISLPLACMIKKSLIHSCVMRRRIFNISKVCSKWKVVWVMHDTDEPRWDWLPTRKSQCFFLSNSFNFVQISFKDVISYPNIPHTS